MKAWISFLKERFDPLSNTAMITLLIFYHQSFSAKVISYDQIALCFLFSFSFFLKLRIYDEIKDYQTDLIHNPTRPLPRGLITIKSAKRVLLVTFFIEGATLFYDHHLSAILIPLWAYSLLMYNEFFIGSWLSKKLTTYAITHTFIIFIYSLFIQEFLNIELETTSTIILALSCWLCFNVYEFARKVYCSELEKDVPTYSNVWGIKGAFLLTLSQVLMATICLLFLSHDLIFASVAINLIALLFMSPLLIWNRPKQAMIFRMTSNVFIIIFLTTTIAFNTMGS